jgi:hypothetical protein
LSDYALYSAERQLYTALNENKLRLCSDRLDVNDQRHHHIHQNVFGKRAGDILYLYQCTKRISKIREDKRCFSDIPIDDETVPFIDPITRISKTVSPPVHCNSQFPLTVETTSGKWVQISPRVSPVAPPEIDHVANLDFTHDSLTDGGTYKEIQWQNWRLQLEQQSYTNALMGTLAYGTAINQGLYEDPESEFNFDLNRLIPVKTLLHSVDLLARLDEFVKRWGGYLALVVLLLETGKLCISIGIFTYSAVIDGPVGMLFIIRSLCCVQYTTSTKQRRSAKRNAQKRQGESEFMMMRGRNNQVDDSEDEREGEAAARSSPNPT